MELSNWGTVTKMRWVIVDPAPLTASGLNEILAGAMTKVQAEKLATLLGYNITGKNSPHKLVRITDLIKPTTKGTSHE